MSDTTRDEQYKAIIDVLFDLLERANNTTKDALGLCNDWHATARLLTALIFVGWLCGFAVAWTWLG